MPLRADDALSSGFSSSARARFLVAASAIAGPHHYKISGIAAARFDSGQTRM